MPQIFPRAANTLAKVSLIGALLSVALVIWGFLTYTRSSYGTGAGLVHVQEVPFSHQHHVGVLGIDCRYCHTTVERSSFATFPPTKTCMNCHSQIWVGSETLAPVRDSYASLQSAHEKPLRWKRVYNLPDYVYFDHSIHVYKGIGCTTCHGRIDEMPFTYQVPSLLMEWCLDCHRNPHAHLRPQEAIFDLKWSPPPNQEQIGKELDDNQYHLRDSHFLTSCTVCHR
jgi:hypothetical protein